MITWWCLRSEDPPAVLGDRRNATRKDKRFGWERSGGLGVGGRNESERLCYLFGAKVIFWKVRGYGGSRLVIHPLVPKEANAEARKAAVCQEG